MKWKLFNKKKPAKPEISWFNITIGQYMAIRKLQTEANDNNHAGLKLFEIITGVNPDTVRPEVFAAKLSEIQEGLNKDFPDIKLPKKITLGDTIYKPTVTSEDITVSQYFDFYQYNKNLEENLLEILSIFLVPAGHKYNDGYDLDKVREDISNYLTVPYIRALVKVFQKRWKKYIRAFQDYSIMEILRLKEVTVTQKATLIRSVKAICKGME